MPNKSTKSREHENSLGHRFFFKLLANIVTLGINVGTYSIAPRLLGTHGFGVFDYLSGFFREVINFLDSGTSTYYFTKLCKDPSNEGLKRFYWHLFFLLVTVGAGVIALLLISGVGAKLWPGLPAYLIWIGFGLGVSTWVSLILNKMVDALGLTVAGEIARVLQRLIALAALSLLFYFQFSQVEIYFGYQVGVFMLASFLWWRVIRRQKQNVIPMGLMNRGEYRRHFDSMWRYSSPLILYSFVGMIVLVGDRWLLANFYGMDEQGLFGLSFRVAAVCFLFAGAIAPLFTRELSKATGDGNEDRVSELMQRFLPLFFFISAYFSVFVAFHAETVIWIFGGSEFSNAHWAMTLMAFYPIHQTYGQLTASAYFATERTRIYRTIGITQLIVGLVFTFFFLAPSRLGGLNLGASGLAAKMVLIQLLSVNIQMVIIARILKVNWQSLLWHQLFTIALLMVIAASVKWGVSQIITLPDHWAFVVSGIVYSLTCLVGVLILPSLTGMSRADVRVYLDRLYNKIISFR